MEISFPPPAGAAPPGPPPAIARSSANAPRSLGGPSAGMIARAPTGSSSRGGSSSGDQVVAAVLRAMREENEHLGILDGIDPLF
jgi:hypothetical protein